MLAIYGLRRALFAMLPDRALALLAGVPMRKVTVAKEAVRLTGELRAAAAFARLEALAAGPLHREIRMALMRALWDHLDREPTWAVFERAADVPGVIAAMRACDPRVPRGDHRDDGVRAADARELARARRLGQLRQLRADPSAFVAGAAARLWPPREQDPGWA